MIILQVQNKAQRGEVICPGTLEQKSDSDLHRGCGLFTSSACSNSVLNSIVLASQLFPPKQALRKEIWSREFVWLEISGSTREDVLTMIQGEKKKAKKSVAMNGLPVGATGVQLPCRIF